MKTQIELLLKLLYEKDDRCGLTQYEEGIKDVLDLIDSQDGYEIDEMIKELKDER